MAPITSGVARAPPRLPFSHTAAATSSAANTAWIAHTFSTAASEDRKISRVADCRCRSTACSRKRMPPPSPLKARSTDCACENSTMRWLAPA